MLLFVLASLGIFVLEDEVNLSMSVPQKGRELFSETYLVGSTAFIRTKHDHVRRAV